jgi:hypothetical protein
MGPTDPLPALDAPAATDAAPGARPVAPGPSPLVLAGVPLIVGVLLWALFSGEDDDATLAPPASAPPLFAAASACPHDGPGTAHQRAEEDERAALAMIDRYPFAPEDGVAAVARFRRAHACFRDAGDAGAAARLRTVGDAAQRRVEGDYRKRVFRLQRALEAGEVRSALLEVRALRVMLGVREGVPYVAWLERLEHALALRLRRPAKKAP